MFSLFVWSLVTCSPFKHLNSHIGPHVTSSVLDGAKVAIEDEDAKQDEGAPIIAVRKQVRGVTRVAINRQRAPSTAAEVGAVGAESHGQSTVQTVAKLHL